MNETAEDIANLHYGLTKEEFKAAEELKSFKRQPRKPQRLQRDFKAPLIHPAAHGKTGLKEEPYTEEDFVPEIWEYIVKMGWHKDPNFAQMLLPTKDLISAEDLKAIKKLHPKLLQAKEYQMVNEEEQRVIGEMKNKVDDATYRKMRMTQKLKSQIRNKELYGTKQPPK